MSDELRLGTLGDDVGSDLRLGTLGDSESSDLRLGTLGDAETVVDAGPSVPLGEPVLALSGASVPIPDLFF